MIYILEKSDGSVILGGQAVNADMLEEGWKPYTGTIPKGEAFKLVEGVLTVTDDGTAKQGKAAGEAITQMLDTLAQSWEYKSYESARGYRGDHIPKFNAEGTALARYGSTCFDILDQIRSGAVPTPSDVQALMLLMPSPPARPVAPY